ncbi:MAG: hypothetical protein HYU39_08175 [Thaumarchaeota archaeon]|nr:hypothetical protein [Nitrososphaerota archaeon]
MPYHEMAASFSLPFALGLISALAVIIPGIILLVLIRGVNKPVLRNLTIMLASFAILHGIYHILLILGQSILANPVDLVSVILLVFFGLYYSARIGG